MSENKTVYVVGEYVKTSKSGAVWDINGIFEKQGDAEIACINDSYFVGPVPFNKALPPGRSVWPGVYYPTLEGRKNG